MEHDLIQLAMAFVAAWGFGYYFNMHRMPLFLGAVGGVICWGLFLLFQQILNGIFLPSLIASAVSAIYAELLAHRYKAPPSIFFIVSVIPLIPGRYLFNTMQSAVELNWPQFWQNAGITGEYAIAIAIGISIVWAVMEVIRTSRIRRSWEMFRRKHGRKA